MRFVFDTNVLVSALLLPNSKPRHAFNAALARGRILVSFAALSELHQVLTRDRFRRYLDEDDIRTFLASLIREAEWIDVDVQIGLCRDARDDKFLELAVSGGATHIISGDSDLLVLDPFRGIRIITPDRLLTL